MIGNIMYGKSCYKIYVIHVKIRNIRKIRIRLLGTVMNDCY